LASPAGGGQLHDSSAICGDCRFQGRSGWRDGFAQFAGGGFTRTGIATIVDMKSNEIEVDVNESYIARVENETEVTATLDAYPDKPIPSKVRTVIPTADRQKATVKVRITIINLENTISFCRTWREGGVFGE